MSLTLNIKGAPATAVAKSGLDQLKELGADDAREILAQLKGDFGTKTGVVRLMHTSKADRFMKFSDAGGFKQMFISGTKLESTGTVIAQLMERSGDFTDKQIEDFKEYASNRGRRGIESQELTTHLKPLKQSTFSTTEAALKALGVTGHQDLDSGGQGSVSKVSMRGQAFAMKTLNTPEALKLETVKRAPENASTLLKPASPDTHQDKTGQLIREQNRASSDFDDHQRWNPKGAHSDSISSNGSEDRQFEDLTAFIFKHSPAFMNQFERPEDEPESPAHDGGRASAAEHGVENALPAFNYKPEVLDDEPQAGATDIAKTEIKIVRTPGIATLARMKDLDQVVQPSHYLITETSRNGTSRVHVVEGGRALKDWAKTQATGSSFKVTQYLMPLAAGKELIKFKDDGSVESMNFKRRDLPDIARSMASLLEKMWQHGFVDGDIKPENLMWDPSSKTLRAIDIDTFQKVSKKPGSAMPTSGDGTLYYTHPNNLYGHEKKPTTLGRDLFASGMVMLEAALRAGGHNEDADRIMLAHENEKRIRYLRTTYGHTLPEEIGNLKKKLNLADRGVEDFAMLCIKTALEYEEKRLAQGINRFERYDENAGPDHPMSILKRHPLMNPVE
jgi:hypothetical protein